MWHGKIILRNFYHQYMFNTTCGVEARTIEAGAASLNQTYVAPCGSGSAKSATEMLHNFCIILRLF
jgi:hypothetical protein